MAGDPTTGNLQCQMANSVADGDQVLVSRGEFERLQSSEAALAEARAYGASFRETLEHIVGYFKSLGALSGTLHDAVLWGRAILRAPDPAATVTARLRAGRRMADLIRHSTNYPVEFYEALAEWDAANRGEEGAV